MKLQSLLPFLLTVLLLLLPACAETGTDASESSTDPSGTVENVGTVGSTSVETDPPVTAPEPEFTYYENGNVKTEMHYRSNGTPEYFIAYHENGYTSEQRDYDEVGNLSSVTTYFDDGIQKDTLCYNEAGSITEKTTTSDDRLVHTVEQYTYHKQDPTHCEAYSKVRYENDCAVWSEEFIEGDPSVTFTSAFYPSGNLKSTEQKTIGGILLELIEYHDNGNFKSSALYYRSGRPELIDTFDENGRRISRVAYDDEEGAIGVKKIYTYLDDTSSR